VPIENHLLAASPPPVIADATACSHRLFFDLKNNNTVEIIGVRHRKEAYRS